MQPIASIEFLRKRFERVLSYYGPQGIAPQLSLIRIDEELINGQGVYNFNLRKEGLEPGEVNLKRNDLFVTLGLGCFLSVHDPERPGTAPLLSFAKQAQPANTDVEPNLPEVAGFNTTDIEALYNGFLYVRTANVVNMSDTPLLIFKSVPVIDGLAKQIGEPEAFELLKYLHIMPEELTYAGTQDHEVRISFPTFAASDYSTSPAGTKGKITFYALGYKVVGGTAEKYKNDSNNPFRGAI